MSSNNAKAAWCAGRALLAQTAGISKRNERQNRSSCPLPKCEISSSNQARIGVLEGAFPSEWLARPEGQKKKNKKKSFSPPLAAGEKKTKHGRKDEVKKKKKQMDT